jgi:hypothetical protein
MLSKMQAVRGDKAAARAVAQRILDQVADGTFVSNESVSPAKNKSISFPVESQDEKYRKLYDAAQTAGLNAANAAAVTPMVVGSPTHILGNDINPNKPVYFVEGGVCGFAGVAIRPGTCSFARWLVKNQLGGKRYYGGVYVNVSEHGQSLQRKEAHAGAMAKVFNDAGINASVDSRLD